MDSTKFERTTVSFNRLNSLAFISGSWSLRDEIERDLRFFDTFSTHLAHLTLKNDFFEKGFFFRKMLNKSLLTKNVEIQSKKKKLKKTVSFKQIAW